MKIMSFIAISCGLLAFDAQAISLEECQAGKKCFCMPVPGASIKCIETNKTQQEIKAEMLSIV